MWRSQVISFLKISFYTIWSHWNPIWQGLGKSLWSGQGWISRITLVLLLEDSPESCPLAKWPHRDTEGVDENGTGDECELDRTPFISLHQGDSALLLCRWSNPMSTSSRMSILDMGLDMWDIEDHTNSKKWAVWCKPNKEVNNSSTQVGL